MNEEQHKLQVYKDEKEKAMRMTQFTGLVENMKFDVLNQYHLEMKWKNEYDVSKMENLQEKMNPYSERKQTGSPNKNAM